MSRISICAWTLVLGLPSLTYPFGHDQSYQALAAYRVLTGEVLYQDIHTLRPPLDMLFHMLSLIFFGHSMTSIRIADLLWTTATAMAAGGFAHIAFREKGGSFMLLAGVLYSHYYYLFNYWHIAQVDGWMNLPLVLAMVLVLLAWREGEGRPGRALLLWGGTGALAATAVLFKYTAIGFVPLLGLAALLSNGWRIKRGLVPAGIYAVGLILTGFIAVGIMAFSGMLEGFVHNHLPMITDYGGAIPKKYGGAVLPLWLGAVKRLVDFRGVLPLAPLIPRTFFIPAGGLVLAIGLLLVRTDSWTKKCLLLILGWTAAGWMSTALQGRFFGYHFLPLVAPGSLLAAFLIGSLVHAPWPRWFAAWQRALVIAVMVVAACWKGPFLWNPLVSHQAQFRHLGGVLSERLTLEDGWRSEFFHYALNFSVRDTVETADYVLTHTGEDDSLFVWGSNTAIYFLTRRPRISKITYSFTSVDTLGFGRSKGGTEQLLRDFQNNPPDIFLVQHGDAIPHILGHRKDSYRLLLESKDLYRFVSRSYLPVVRIGQFEILRLRNKV